MEHFKQLRAHKTDIPGVTLFDIPVYGDSRGWFKENWQQEKMSALGLPDFHPVQNNISYNVHRGATRGIHAEPWDKFISVAKGSVFGAWVDLRDGPSFGTVVTAILDPSRAIYIPCGVGNAFQALEDDTVYTYLVNDHWSAEAQKKYTFVNLDDKQLNIDWPIPLTEAVLSEKDQGHPSLDSVTAMKPKPILVIGANGQLGSALQRVCPSDNTIFLSREDLNISSYRSVREVNWRDYRSVINAAAYTNVDAAETPVGRIKAWETNSLAVSWLAQETAKVHVPLVHISSDYVFDGEQKIHFEDEQFAPLNVYGQSKAAGDLAVSANPNHYIIRTSWVIGNGNNFIRTMINLARKGAKPKVVSDQVGRLTDTDDLAACIYYLLNKGAEYGTYNFSCSGSSLSWAAIASEIFARSGRDAEDVQRITSAQYSQMHPRTAIRPKHSTLSLDKVMGAGFSPIDMKDFFLKYL